MSKKISRVQRRTVQMEVVQDQESGLYTFSFSSETPYERGWWVEILSHEAGAMILDRLLAAGPLLFNHNRDIHLGVVEKAWVESKRGFVTVRFSNSPIGREKRQDVDDKILVNVSFMYEIRDMVLLREEKDSLPEYLVTSFIPYEVSLVTIPADFSVGVDRAAGLPEDEIELPPVQIRSAEPVNAVHEPEDPAPAQVDQVPENKTNERTITMLTPEQMQQRFAKILSIGEKHGQSEFAREFMARRPDATEADFAFELVEKLGGRSQAINSTPLGLSEKDKQRFSISRALTAVLTNNWQAAAFEREVSLEVQKRTGRETSGFFLPTEVMQRAPLNVGTASAGGNLVQTELRGDMFIEMLRERAVMAKAGATILTGIVGNIAIPRQTGGVSYYWVLENGSITETEATFDQVTLSPKQVAGLTEYTKMLLAQGTPSVDAMVTNDLNKAIALGIDSAAISGTGSSGQPRGILNQSGIGNVPIGTNGGEVTFDHIVDLETAVFDANADGLSMAYLTNSRTIGKLKKLKDTNGAYLWNSVRDGANAPLNGYTVHRSNLVPKSLTKGTGTNLSAVIFGDFSQVIIAQWGPGIEILANPYGETSFSKNNVKVRAVSMVDVGIRHAGSFAAVTDAL